MQVSAFQSLRATGSFGLHGRTSARGGAAAFAEPVEEISTVNREREAGGAFARPAHGRRTEPVVDHVSYRDIPETLPPLSSAEFITQHIAQEWIGPAEVVDFRAAARAYERREIRDAAPRDLTRTA